MCHLYEELDQVKEECDDAEYNQPECMQEVKNERIKAEEVKEETDQEDSEDVMETPDMKDASVIKYSVKTTPYLQRWDCVLLVSVLYFCQFVFFYF